jgi:hypothetical protein
MIGGSSPVSALLQDEPTVEVKLQQRLDKQKEKNINQDDKKDIIKLINYIKVNSKL